MNHVIELNARTNERSRLRTLVAQKKKNVLMTKSNDPVFVKHGIDGIHGYNQAVSELLQVLRD